MKHTVTAALCLLLASATALAAQTNAAAPQSAVPQGAFAGYLKSTIEGIPIRLGDIRLFFIDSTKEITGRGGAKTVDFFVDTLRSRIAASDSTGYFAIWRLAPGRYVMQMRRIGFKPIEGFVAVDSETILNQFKMEPLAAILNKVEIHAPSPTSLSRRLDRVGFLDRKKFNASQADFVTRGDIDRYKARTLRDILVRYGIFSSAADFQLDRMALDYWDIQDYPAVLIAAVEIYRRERPTEFNWTVAGPGALVSSATRPLVVIWTYIP